MSEQQRNSAELPRTLDKKQPAAVIRELASFLSSSHRGDEVEVEDLLFNTSLTHAIDALLLLSRSSVITRTQMFALRDKFRSHQLQRWDSFAERSSRTNELKPEQLKKMRNRFSERCFECTASEFMREQGITAPAAAEPLRHHS